MSAHNAPSELHSIAIRKKDPGASGSIIVDKNPCVVPLVSAAAESRTLARPTREGVLLTLFMKTDGGNITLTVTGGYNEDGDTSFTFSDPGQFACFVSCFDGTNYYWRMLTHYGIGNIAPGDAAILDEFSGLTATVAEINARAAAASRIVSIPDATTYTFLAADSGKIHVFPNLTADCTATLPAVSAGLEYEIIGNAVAADAQNWIIKSPSATNYFIGGVAFADTDAGAGADEIHAGVWSNGSSNDFLTVVTPGAGTRLHIICDGLNWIVNGVVFSATVPAFSDT